MFLCPIITHKTLDQFASNFDSEVDTLVIHIVCILYIPQLIICLHNYIAQYFSTVFPNFLLLNPSIFIAVYPTLCSFCNSISGHGGSSTSSSLCPSNSALYIPVDSSTSATLYSCGYLSSPCFISMWLALFSLLYIPGVRFVLLHYISVVSSIPPYFISLRLALFSLLYIPEVSSILPTLYPCG